MRPKLIYLQRHQKAYVHAIYGPNDTLLYPGLDKLITSVNLTSPEPTFTFTSKKAILNDLGVSEDHFLDIGILVGFDYAQPFPPIGHEQALKTTVDLVKYYKSGHAAVSVYADHPVVKSIQYSNTYTRTRSMIKYSLILSVESTVRPLPLALQVPSPNPPHGGNHQSHQPPTANIPTDLHEIFTHRLPDDIYSYLSRGLLIPQPLEWLASAQIIEHPPLDNGEIYEYRRFVKEVITEAQTSPRATALALVRSVAHHFWADRKVAGVFWFDAAASSMKSYTSPQMAQLAERVAGWHVPYAIIEEELREQKVSRECSMKRNGTNMHHLDSPPLSTLRFAWVLLLRKSKLGVQGCDPGRQTLCLLTRRTRWWRM